MMTIFKDKDGNLVATLDASSPIDYRYNTNLAITNIKPNYNISFHRDGVQIGCLDFNGPKMVFIGDADESVKVFVEAFNGWFEQRIAQENEACAKVCENYTDNDGGPFIDHEGHGYECAKAIRERLANTKATGEQS